MDKLTPLIMKFLDEHARPHVQTKVTEEISETKVELKQDLPGTIMEHIQGPESHPMVAEIAASMGDKLLERVKRITEITVETASEGMDLLLTDGVMNIARGAISKATDEEGSGGGFNFDFLKQGKEGMVSTTMIASAPVIKQVSDNMGRKISAHIPTAIGDSIQELIDEHGGSSGALGMAAGLMAKFLNKDGPSEVAVASSRDARDGTEAEGHTGSAIQQMLHKILGPKILILIQPYLEKFEAKMTRSLEGELRTKVFSPDYIKQTVMNMLTGAGGDGEGGGHSGLGGILGAFLQSKGGHSQNGEDGGQGGKEDDPMKAIGNLASQFFKNREN
ncbi:hypothetical protein EDD21DRAFT_393005 [Dissophora ornata]|nr:hypothetical protein BGZ58_000346 [Dissophora ornata]KAI8594747.1 hypothetical protein EDD21DRAFT_393005 [Dissophora ornata]